MVNPLANSRRCLKSHRYLTPKLRLHLTLQGRRHGSLNRGQPGVLQADPSWPESKATCSPKRRAPSRSGLYRTVLRPPGAQTYWFWKRPEASHRRQPLGVKVRSRIPLQHPLPAYRLRHSRKNRKDSPPTATPSLPFRLYEDFDARGRYQGQGQTDRFRRLQA